MSSSRRDKPHAIYRGTVTTVNYNTNINPLTAATLLRTMSASNNHCYPEACGKVEKSLKELYFIDIGGKDG